MAMPGGLSPEKQSSWQKFKTYLKDNKLVSKGLEHLSKLQVLSKYKNTLGSASAIAGSLGYGAGHKHTKKSKMLHDIHMRGGSWSDFTNWVKGAANTVGKVVKRVGNLTYDNLIKPAYNYVKEKPLTLLSQAASYIPVVGPTASKVLGTAASLTGKGMWGISNGHPTNPLLQPYCQTMAFNKGMAGSGQSGGAYVNQFDMIDSGKPRMLW